MSAHYVVKEDGSILRLVEEGHRAWHAGRGSWRGQGDINSRSVGIEIVNGGHDYDLPPYPDVQIDSVIALSRDILERHDITQTGIVGHSDIAPDRKEDPGEHFPWGKLAAAGVGFWPNADKVSPPVDVARVPEVLKAIGYDFGPENDVSLTRCGHSISAPLVSRRDIWPGRQSYAVHAGRCLAGHG